MTIPKALNGFAGVASASLMILGSAERSFGQKPGHIDAAMTTPADDTPDTQPIAPTEDAPTSTEQGRTPLADTFEGDGRQWRIQKRRQAFKDTQFQFNFRSFYFDRNKLDGTESEAFTVGGWFGLKTGYFFDHLAIGATVYTSQKLYGPDDKDGTLLLKSGQDPYSVLGELYADIRFTDDIHLYVGRKGFDTPFINKNDVRMTPNTFEAIVLQGKADFGKDGGSLKYGVGYFDKIKERNSDKFVSMAKDAGASVDRGVFTAGALYKKGDFSVGAIDYYSDDIINIGYTEATLEVPVSENFHPKFAAQFVDQRSVGDDLLQGHGFSGQQFGIKAELPVKQALFTAAYTQTTKGTNMQNPWSGYPGYTSVQVEDFNRSGEGALLLRAGYECTCLKGLSAYALWVHGTNPSDSGQFGKDEYNVNAQWAPPEGVLKGLSLRVRYGIVDQRGGDTNTLTDFRAICNYSITF